MNKLIRIATVPNSLSGLLKGQLRFMSENGYKVIAVSSSGAPLEEVKKREGVETVAIDMSRKITPLQDLKSLYLIYKLLKKEKPLFVHSHTPKAGTIGMVAAWLAGVPYRMHTIAGLPLLEAKGKKRWLLDWVEKITYKCATHIYPNSYGLKDIIIKNKYTTPQKLKVIGEGSSNGINTSYFSPSLYSIENKETLRSNLGISKDDFVYIFVGRLVGDKGINELVEAFSDISAKFKQTKLVLVGSYEKDLDPLNENTIKTIVNNENIIHVGFQSDVRPYFAIANLLVFPSYREGFPNVVMQAGAMGLASIVTNINGCNEIIIEGENGIIIPTKDKKSLTEKMELLISNSELLKDLSSNARELITSRYEQQIVWDALLEEYKSLEKDYQNV